MCYYRDDEAQSMKSVMDDKAAIRECKPIYDLYGNEERESMYDDDSGVVDAYDDEYDDTYDVNTVGADDADSADELTSKR